MKAKTETTKTTKTTKTSKRGDGLFPARDTYRVAIDAGGINPPPFANAPRPAAARYAIHYGLPVAYVTRHVIHATRDGVATDPTRLGGGAPETDRQLAFAAALEDVFAAAGFARHPSGIRYVHRDHGDTYLFDRLSVGSDGVFAAEAQCGMRVIRYEIVDHATAQSILDAATDERGMI